MKTSVSLNRVAFDDLISLFIKRSKRTYILDPSVGKGYVQIYNLEKGLQARFWDCCFNEPIELYSDVDPKMETTYFTLAFFLNLKGVQFSDNGSFLQKNTIWDTVFISAASNYKLFMAPKARCHCLSISFSKRWLSNNVLQDDKTSTILKANIETGEPFSILESMSSSEKKLIQELVDASWKNTFKSFFIKCCVLKIVCDFFNKINQRKTFITSKPSMAEVESYLCNHITSSLPCLKDLTQKFSISESTLLRHFKKKYGTNMSAYFVQKKMEYAQQLLDEKNMSVKEVAGKLGYKNVNSFIKMFSKQYGKKSLLF